MKTRSEVTLPTGFELPRAELPVFLINAALIGAVWAVLRLTSRSIIVSSVSHGVWNGLAFGLFGYGTKVGALNVESTRIFGPENGIVGLTLNALVLSGLLLLLRRQFSNSFTGLAGARPRLI